MSKTAEATAAKPPNITAGKLACFAALTGKKLLLSMTAVVVDEKVTLPIKFISV
jgi:hypothetical protein